jgi:hypothetical protein
MIFPFYREVYYDANNLRRDVVTYKPVNVDKIGSLTGRYNMPWNLTL